MILLLIRKRNPELRGHGVPSSSAVNYLFIYSIADELLNNAIWVWKFLLLLRCRKVKGEAILMYAGQLGVLMILGVYE